MSCFSLSNLINNDAVLNHFTFLRVKCLVMH